MRFLHIIDSMDPARGGPVESILRNAAEMARLGHRSAVMSLDRASDPWVSKVPLDHYPQDHFFRRYGYSPRLANWLKAEAQGYDAAIIHGLWTYATVGSARVLSRLGMPYFVFAHGMMDPWFSRTQPVKSLIKKLYWRLLLGPALAGARAVLFTTEEERRLARLAFPQGSYRARTVAYGTADVEGDAAEQITAFREQIPALGSRPFLLFLGRLHPKKGCDLLIRAFAKFTEAQPELDLVIAGPDQTGCLKSLTALADELWIAERVHFPGMLSGAAKWGAFRASEAFILPSHQENFGIAVAEAMACGKPVLITDKVNIWRKIEISRSGLVASDDQSGIDDLLTRYFQLSQDDRGAMGMAARCSYLAHFGIENATRGLLAIIEEEKSLGSRFQSAPALL